MRIKKTLFFAVFALFTWQELLAFQILNFTNTALFLCMQQMERNGENWVSCGDPYAIQL